MSFRFPWSRANVARLAVVLGIAVSSGTCANRRAAAPPGWAATPQAQVGGPTRSAPPPPVTPELDPERVEQRFGFAEAKARRDFAQQNKKPAALTTGSQAVVPIPQGATAPTIRPPSSPDAGTDARR